MNLFNSFKHFYMDVEIFYLVMSEKNIRAQHKKIQITVTLVENTNKTAKDGARMVFQCGPYGSQKEEGSGSVGRLRGHVRV